MANSKCEMIACDKTATHTITNPETGAEEHFCSLDIDFIRDIYASRAARMKKPIGVGSTENAPPTRRACEDADATAAEKLADDDFEL